MSKKKISAKGGGHGPMPPPPLNTPLYAATRFKVQMSLSEACGSGPTDYIIETIRNSPIGVPPTSPEPFHLLADYTLSDIADRFAPLHSVQSRICPMSPWFDADCGNIRRNCRRLNKYRRTKDVDKLAWIEWVPQKHRSIRAKANSYWACKHARLRNG